jgi:antitoxin MazE
MAAVQRWGNSLAVRIPAPLAKQLQVTEGSPVDVSVREGTLVVRPHRRQYRLKDLLKQCKPSQLHGEIDFGPDVGREVIE